MAPFFDPIDKIKAQVELYREAAAKAGKTPHIALLRDGWLASSVEEAEQTFGRLWLEECKFYFKWGMLEPTAGICLRKRFHTGEDSRTALPA